MIGCYLIATGDFFDVDAFGAKSSLIPDFLGRLGEPTGFKDRVHNTNRFSVMINEDFGNLETQIGDALKYVSENEPELTRLAYFPNVSVLRLVFTYCTENKANTSKRFPKDLLTLLGRIGIEIEISIYPGDFHRPNET
jgi:hypothetical protein